MLDFNTQKEGTAIPHRPMLHIGRCTLAVTMDGIIVNQDDMSIVIRRGASESLLFKHAISTIRRGRLPDHKD